MKKALETLGRRRAFFLALCLVFFVFGGISESFLFGFRDPEGPEAAMVWRLRAFANTAYVTGFAFFSLAFANEAEPLRLRERFFSMTIFNAPLRRTLRVASAYRWSNLPLFGGFALFAYGAALDVVQRLAARGVENHADIIALGADHRFMMIQFVGAGLIAAKIAFDALLAPFQRARNLRHAYPEDWRASLVRPSQVLLGVVFAPFFLSAVFILLLACVTTLQYFYFMFIGADRSGQPQFYFWLWLARIWTAGLAIFTIIVTVRARLLTRKFGSHWGLLVWGAVWLTFFMMGRGSPLPTYWGAYDNDPWFLAGRLLLLERFLWFAIIAGVFVDLRRLLRQMSLPPDSWMVGKSRAAQR